MTYNPLVITYYSNSPVAPRIDGGYYVSFADKNEILHVLSYDKDDNLYLNLCYHFFLHYSLFEFF